MVNLLLGKKDVDRNPRDNLGWTPLAHACFANKVANMRSLLSHRDIDPNPVANNGVSLLAKVKQNRWKERESLLRAGGAR